MRPMGPKAMIKVLSGSGGEEVKLLEEKNKQNNQSEPKVQLFFLGGGLIGSKSLLKKIKANSACILPSPTPFREGAHRKKVLSGLKKVSAE